MLNINKNTEAKKAQHKNSGLHEQTLMFFAGELMCFTSDFSAI